MASNLSVCDKGSENGSLFSIPPISSYNSISHINNRFPNEMRVDYGRWNALEIVHIVCLTPPIMLHDPVFFQIPVSVVPALAECT